MKRIAIIGAERGLGLGLSKELLGRGWHVTATARTTNDTADLQRLGQAFPDRLAPGTVDVTDAAQGRAFARQLAQGGPPLDAVFLVAGIWGALHQSMLDASEQEWTEVFHTNTVGPFRLARLLLPCLAPRGTVAFMSSHRASIAGNVEGGMELYRASKAALNMLSRGLYAELAPGGGSVLNIHPGWVATAMGTLDGAVQAEIDVATSVRGVADQLELAMGSGEHRYLDYRGEPLAW